MHTLHDTLGIAPQKSLHIYPFILSFNNATTTAHFSLEWENAANCHANGVTVLLNIVFVGKYR